MSEEKRNPSLWEIAKSVSLFLITAVVAIKAFLAPIELKLDAPTLISLLLALFSIWLSALFYFKASETSNTFYDNTYKFTRDIAQLLARMESGFGEKLRSLDEGYASMRNQMQSGGKSSNDELEKNKQKLDDEKEELKRTVEARNKIVRDLLERSQLQKGEREEIAESLKQKESELLKAQEEIAKLNRKITINRVRSQVESGEPESSEAEAMNRFTDAFVIRRLGAEFLAETPSSGIKAAFAKILGDLPRSYVRDMEKFSYFDGDLLMTGVRYLRRRARRQFAAR